MILDTQRLDSLSELPSSYSESAYVHKSSKEQLKSFGLGNARQILARKRHSRWSNKDRLTKLF